MESSRSNDWTQEKTPLKGQSKPWWRVKEQEILQGTIQRFFQTKDVRSGVSKACCEVKLTAAARCMVDGGKDPVVIQPGVTVAVEIKPGMRAVERYPIGTEIALQAIDKSGTGGSWTFRVAHRGLVREQEAPATHQAAPEQAEIPF